MTDYLSLVSDLIRQARTAGADAADAVLVNGTSLSVAVPPGQDRASGAFGRPRPRAARVRRQAGRHRVFFLSRPGRLPGPGRASRGDGQGRPGGPFTGLADTWAPPDETDLDMADPAEPAPELLAARAAAAEDAAYSVHGVTNSEGAEAGYGRNEVVLVTSAGFAGTAHRHQPFDLGHRPGRRRNRHAARLRLSQHGLLRRPRRPGENRQNRRRTRHRQVEPDAAEYLLKFRSSSIPASPAVCWAIWPVRSMASASLAAPVS